MFEEGMAVGRQPQPVQLNPVRCDMQLQLSTNLSTCVLRLKFECQQGLQPRRFDITEVKWSCQFLDQILVQFISSKSGSLSCRCICRRGGSCRSGIPEARSQHRCLSVELGSTHLMISLFQEERVRGRYKRKSYLTSLEESRSRTQQNSIQYAKGVSMELEKLSDSSFSFVFVAALQRQLSLIGSPIRLLLVFLQPFLCCCDTPSGSSCPATCCSSSTHSATASSASNDGTIWWWRFPEQHHVWLRPWYRFVTGLFSRYTHSVIRFCYRTPCC